MSRALSEGGGGLRWSAAARFLAEAAAVASLGFLIARLALAAWPPLVETPLLPAPGPLSAQAAVASGALDPFRRSGAADALAAAVVEAPATTLALALLGVRAQADGRGSAIIQTPDNQQRRYAVGDVILDGAVLEAVEQGRVTIRRADGSVESLAFSPRESLLAGASAGAASAASSRTVSIQALTAGVTVAALADGRVSVSPAGDGAAFAASGLASGDVVLAVDGVALATPEAVQATLGALGPGSTVSVSVERAGAPVLVQFTLE